MGLIEFLVFYEHATVFLKTLWETGKEWMRQTLGPSSTIQYLLLEHDAVIPATMAHNNVHVAMYNPTDRRITAISDTPYKRLPWLSMQYTFGDRIVDISDWMSEVRTNTPVSLISILRLASHIQSIYLPETDHAVVKVITRDGEEEEYKYKGMTKLVKRITPEPIELRRKQTCPYDTAEGMPLI